MKMKKSNSQEEVATKTLVKRRECVGGTRVYYKFHGYHFYRPTEVYFRCEHCPFEEEVREWLYVKSLSRWCLHLGKFHKCTRGPRKTVKCSQKILPAHARKWPTISNDTAKKFLKLGDLMLVNEAPPPEPIEIPGKSKIDERAEGSQKVESLKTLEAPEKEKDGKPLKGIKRALPESKSSLDQKVFPAKVTRRRLSGSLSDSGFEDELDDIDFSPFKNDTAQSLMTRHNLRFASGTDDLVRQMGSFSPTPFMNDFKKSCDASSARCPPSLCDRLQEISDCFAGPCKKADVESSMDMTAPVVKSSFANLRSSMYAVGASQQDKKETPFNSWDKMDEWLMGDLFAPLHGAEASDMESSLGRSPYQDDPCPARMVQRDPFFMSLSLRRPGGYWKSEN